MQNNHKYKYIILTCFLWLLTLLIFWPGALRSDSLGQLQQAISGSFTDHHPPLMAYLWQIFNKIIPGSGLMFAFHNLLYWIAIYFFSQAIPRYAILTFIIASLPPLIIFQPLVLKDIGFSNSFLLITGYLAYITIHNHKPKILSILLLLLALFYGAAIKFQGIFTAFIILFWLFYVLNNFKVNIYVFLKTCVSQFLLWLLISGFNALVSSPSYSWQLVKLYDLAGISVQLNKPIFPEFVMQNKNFSLEKVKNFYNYRRVDDLALTQNATLITGKNQYERDTLLKLWRKTIIRHYKEYLQHRLGIFREQLTISILKSPEQVSNSDLLVPIMLQSVDILAKLGLLNIFKWLTSYGIVFPLQLIYSFLGLIYCRSNKYARVLLGVNLLGLSLVLVLFFFSMAREARYVYLSLCCVHLSLPLLIMMHKQSRKLTN